MRCQEDSSPVGRSWGGLVVRRVALEVLRAEIARERERERQEALRDEGQGIQGQRDSGMGMSCRAYETVVSPCWGLG